MEKGLRLVSEHFDIQLVVDTTTTKIYYTENKDLPPYLTIDKITLRYLSDLEELRDDLHKIITYLKEEAWL